MCRSARVLRGSMIALTVVTAMVVVLAHATIPIAVVDIIEAKARETRLGRRLRA